MKQRISRGISQRATDSEN